jgi:hypothetical protein
LDSGESIMAKYTREQLEKMTPEQLRAIKQQMESQQMAPEEESLPEGIETSPGEALARGAIQGIPLIGTFMDEFTALFQTLREADTEEKFLDAYKRILEQKVRPEYKAAAEQYPELYHPAEIAVGIATGGMLAKSGVKLAQKFLPEFIAGIWGASDGDILSGDVDSIRKIGSDFAGGALFTGGLKVAGKTVKAIRWLAEVFPGIEDTSHLTRKAFEIASKGVKLRTGDLASDAMPIHTTDLAEGSIEEMRDLVTRFNTAISKSILKNADEAKVAKTAIIAELDAAYPKGLPKEDLANEFVNTAMEIALGHSMIPEKMKRKGKAADIFGDIYENFLYGKNKALAKKEIQKAREDYAKNKTKRLSDYLEDIVDYEKIPDKDLGPQTMEFRRLLRDNILTFEELKPLAEQAVKDAHVERLQKIAKKYVVPTSAEEVDKLRGDIWEMLSYGKSKLKLQGQEIALDVPESGAIRDPEARKNLEAFAGKLTEKLDQYASKIGLEVDDFPEQPISRLNETITKSLRLKQIAEKYGARDFMKIRSMSESKTADNAFNILGEIKEQMPEIGEAIDADIGVLSNIARITQSQPAGRRAFEQTVLYNPRVGISSAIEGMGERAGSLTGSIQRRADGMLDNTPFIKAVLTHKAPHLVGEFLRSKFADDKETLAQIAGDIAPEIEEFMEPSPVKAKGVRIKSAIESPRYEGAYKITNPGERALLAEDIMSDKSLSEKDRFEMVESLNSEGILKRLPMHTDDKPVQDEELEWKRSIRSKPAY